jgi:UDP:flavonoid glycosyltransferase YjiC (YdhE family)
MRVLLTSTRGGGHALPLLPFARACRDAGLDVLIAGPPPVESVADRAGVAFHRVGEADPEHLSRVGEALSGKPTMERVRLATTDLFVGAHGAAALPEMVRLVGAWQPDVILRETAEVSSQLAAEAFGVPVVRIGIALATPYEDWWLAMAADALDLLRAEVGVAPDPGARRALLSPLFTQVPAVLDEHQGDLPVTVRRYRAGDDAPAPLPGWWKDAGAPLVPISFGTVVPTDGHYPGVYRAAIDAVAQLPVRVLVTIGRQADPARLGPLPANVHVERWVDQARVMPHASALVAHGGAGTTLAALAAGVPMALLPLSADQPLNARRMVELGAGLALEGGVADAGRLGALVAALLEDDGYRAAARGVAEAIAALARVSDAVGDLEALVQRASDRANATVCG